MVDETVLNEAEGSFDDPIDLETADFGDASEIAADAATGEEDAPAVQADDETPDTSVADDVPEVEAVAAADVDEEGGEGDEAPVPEPMLPKHRYDSVRRQLRETEAALEAERKAKADAGEPETPAPAARDFDAELGDLNEKFTQALLDADSKEAATLNQQMMALQTERVQSIIAESRDDVVSESRDSVLTDTLVDELVASNAALNPDSDKFDQQLVTRLNSMRKYYEQGEGLTESQALVKTVETLMPAAFESKTPPAKDGGKKLADKLEKASGQPPNTNDVGEDGPSFGQGEELVASKLTLDDLDNVTEAQWDHMLGNNL